MRILIVDDSSTTRRILCNVLREAGYGEFLEAADGEAALGILESEQPDVVLLDWNMPRLNGLETLKRIRAAEATKDLPVIMVTTEADRHHVLAAVKAGANNYVVKPFEAATIREKVEAVLG